METPGSSLSVGIVTKTVAVSTKLPKITLTSTSPKLLLLNSLKSFWELPRILKTLKRHSKKLWHYSMTECASKNALKKIALKLTASLPKRC